MFASRTLIEHLLRGVVGLGALATAVALGPAHPLRALALIPLAMVSLRGCPTCWTVGLVQTVLARLRGRAAPDACLDGSCAAREQIVRRALRPGP